MNELEIKNYLIKKLNGAGILSLGEVNLIGGLARVDMLAIQNGVHGFEIKGDNDSLSRLPRQIATYAKVFNTVTVVCTDKHLEGVFESVPEWFGVMSYGKQGLTTLRTASVNPMVQARFILRSMTKREVDKYLSSDRSLAGKLGCRYQDVQRRVNSNSVDVSEMVQLFESCLKFRI